MRARADGEDSLTPRPFRQTGRAVRSRRDARAAESARLESVCGATHRGFESHSLRHGVPDDGGPSGMVPLSRAYRPSPYVCSGFGSGSLLANPAGWFRTSVVLPVGRCGSMRAAARSATVDSAAAAVTSSAPATARPRTPRTAGAAALPSSPRSAAAHSSTSTRSRRYSSGTSFLAVSQPEHITHEAVSGRHGNIVRGGHALQPADHLQLLEAGGLSPRANPLRYHRTVTLRVAYVRPRQRQFRRSSRWYSGHAVPP
jgi:hypothetical protein